MSDNPNAEVLTALAAFRSELAQRLDKSASELIQDLDKIDSKITQRLNKIEGNVTGFRTDIMARIDRLQARVDQLHDDLKVRHGTADRALLRADRAQSDISALLEMQSTLLKMQRRSSERLDKLEGDSDDTA